MKQSNENLPTVNADDATCNGHPDDRLKARKDSDNDDSGTNTSSTSSVNEVSVNNGPNTSSSSSNLNSSEATTTNPNALNEMVVLPEVSYNIRVQATGLEIFDLPVGDERQTVSPRDLSVCASRSRSPRVNWCKKFIKCWWTKKKRVTERAFHCNWTAWFWITSLNWKASKD